MNIFGNISKHQEHTLPPRLQVTPPYRFPPGFNTWSFHRPHQSQPGGAWDTWVYTWDTSWIQYTVRTQSLYTETQSRRVFRKWESRWAWTSGRWVWSLGRRSGVWPFLGQIAVFLKWPEKVIFPAWWQSLFVLLVCLYPNIGNNIRDEPELKNFKYLSLEPS